MSKNLADIIFAQMEELKSQSERVITLEVDNANKHHELQFQKMSDHHASLLEDVVRDKVEFERQVEESCKQGYLSEELKATGKEIITKRDQIRLDNEESPGEHESMSPKTLKIHFGHPPQ